MAEYSFDQLARLSTRDGLFEHALGAVPRREHGYCVDDVARGLVVTAREPEPGGDASRLARIYLRFCVNALDGRGRMRNRRRVDGSWQDRPGVGDHWGRGVWAMGVAASTSPDPEVRALALRSEMVALRARSSWPRAMAYAALGAAEVRRARPDSSVALHLLVDARAVIGRPSPDAAWPWPEPRLTYANAVLPEAMIAIGDAVHDQALIDDGLALLDWLLAQQTVDGRLSLVAVGGRGPGDRLPAFDQQPIEATALAEACRRAYDVTSDPSWLRAVDLCADWFRGANDAGLAMIDPVTGGGFDGLGPSAVNLNQGAESTLAAIATMQLHRLVHAEPAR